MSQYCDVPTDEYVSLAGEKKMQREAGMPETRAIELAYIIRDTTDRVTRLSAWENLLKKADNYVALVHITQNASSLEDQRLAENELIRKASSLNLIFISSLNRASFQA